MLTPLNKAVLKLIVLLTAGWWGYECVKSWKAIDNA